MDNNYGMAGGMPQMSQAGQGQAMPPMSPNRQKSMVEPRRTVVAVPEKKVWYWWVIGIMAVVVLALAGVLIWALMSKPKEEGNNPSAEALQEIASLKAEIQHDKDAREIVEILRGVVEERLKQAAGDVPYVPAVVWSLYDSSVPAYQPDGMLVKMELTRAYAFRIENTDNEVVRDALMGDELADKLVGVLESRGYKLYAEAMGAGDYLNEQTGIICGLGTHSVPFVVSCGYIGWINQDDAERALLNELAEAYRKKQGEYPAWLVASTQGIHDSSQAPYQTLTASLGGAAGLFYRRNVESEWQFFAGVQAVLDCTAYGTEEERKAFADEVCYYEGAQQNMMVGDLLYESSGE